MPKDVISKYYKIAEFFDDDIDSIAIAIRAVGATNKPTWIYRDLTELWIKKYEEQIDFLYELITNPLVIQILKEYVTDIKKLGEKYNFKPSHFIRKGALSCKNIDVDKKLIGGIVEFFIDREEKLKIKNNNNRKKQYSNKQLLFNFEWE